MRKMISFKIENLPEKQRKIVDDWANSQANIQQSLANLVMHVVAHSGNADVMDFDVQRELHLIFGNSEIKQVKNQVAPEPKRVEPHTPGGNDNDVYTKASWFDE